MSFRVQIIFWNIKRIGKKKKKENYKPLRGIIKFKSGLRRTIKLIEYFDYKNKYWLDVYLVTDC